MRKFRMARHAAGMLTLALLLSISVGMGAFAQTTTLHVMHCWDAHRTEWVDEMLASFEAANPGIEVETQLVGCGVLMDNFITAYLGGVAPDIVMIHSLDIPQNADMGALVALDALRDRDGISMDTWYPSEVGTAIWDGQLYGFPIRTGGDVNALLYYNRDLLSEAGLDPDAPPATWNEWLEMSRRMTHYQNDELVRAGTALYGGDFSEVAYLATAGGQLLSEDGRSVAFNDERGIAAMEFALELATSNYRGGWAEYHQFAASGDSAAFMNGQLAMHTGGILSYSYYRTDAPQIDFGITVRPSREDGGPSGANAGTFHWSIVSTSEHVDAAWDLLKWISLQEETGGKFMLRQGRPSPVAAFNQNPAYFDTNPYWMVVGQALQRVTALPQYPFTRAVMNHYAGALGGVAWQDEAPVVAMERAAREAQGAIDEYWRNR